MSGIRTGTVTSADGTVIAFDRSGAGPAVVLIQGALNDRADPVTSGLAAGLSVVHRVQLRPARPRRQR